MESLRMTAKHKVRISVIFREAAQILTSSDQGDKDCNDRKEYRDVFDNLRKLSAPAFIGSENDQILTMARRCFLTLILKMGACICFDGRSQTANNHSVGSYLYLGGDLQSKNE